MKPRILVLFALCLGALSAQPADAVDPTGRWTGAIEIPGQPLGITVDVAQVAGEWRATIDIPAQGVRNGPLSEVSVEGKKVAFLLDGVPGEPRFRGKLSGSDKIAGTFQQGPGTFPFRLERLSGVAAADLGPNQAPRPEVQGVPGEGFEGVWLGDVGAAIKLRLLVRLERDAEGKWSGSLDSIDQGAMGLRITRIEARDSLLKFGLTTPKASFEGLLTPDGSTINGTWLQGGQTTPLKLMRQRGEPDLARPQEPKPPLPYEQVEVVYENSLGGVRLAATLTLPPGEGPFPAALLLTGSGAQDRDETILGHKPFLILADALARRGIATLRADDRGVGGSTGRVSDSTTADFAADARAGVEFLRGRKRIDPKKIGLIGHSEGAWVAPLAAQGSTEVAFVVLLAHPSLRGDEVIYLQRRRMSEKTGLLPGEEIEAQVELQRKLFAALEEEPDDERAAARMQVIVDEQIDQRMGDQPEEMRAMMKQSAMGMRPNRWFRAFLHYDPLPAARALSVPVLALFGEKDLQVPAPENAALLKDALGEALTSDFEVETLPGLNHLFQTSQTGLPQEYAQIEETFAPVALERIGGWIEERFVPPGG